MSYFIIIKEDIPWSEGVKPISLVIGIIAILNATLCMYKMAVALRKLDKGLYNYIKIKVFIIHKNESKNPLFFDDFFQFERLKTYKK